MTVQLDPGFYPHIFATILSSVDYQTLLSARHVCAALCTLADAELERKSLALKIEQDKPLVIQRALPGMPVVPTSSVHSSVEARTRLVRNLRQVVLEDVESGRFAGVNDILERIDNLEHLLISIERSRPPRMAFRVPRIERLALNLPILCPCVETLAPAEQIQHNAANVSLTMHDLRCQDCQEEASTLALDLDFHLDGLINSGVQKLTIYSERPDQVLSHFRSPNASRNPNLTIAIETDRSSLYPDYDEVVAEAKERYARVFDIPEAHIWVYPNDYGFLGSEYSSDEDSSD